MAKGILRLIDVALENVGGEISSSRNESSLFSRGLSGEGYNAGYRDALHDVINALNGVTPKRNGWWYRRESFVDSTSVRDEDGAGEAE